MVCRKQKGRANRFCSHECDRLHRGYAVQAVPSHSVCKNCGKPFERIKTKGQNEQMMFCSVKCMALSRRKLFSSWIEYKHCPVCRDMFTSHSSQDVYCSVKCQRRAHRRSKAQPVLRCAECGNVFVPEDWRRDTYCSALCMRKRARRISKARRRARIKTSSCESIDPMEVFCRDKWICQICGVKVLRSRRGSCHPRAPELDHIVALSLGGAHTLDNVQCSCRACNGLKGGSVAGQLRLW